MSELKGFAEERQISANRDLKPCLAAIAWAVDELNLVPLQWQTTEAEKQVNGMVEIRDGGFWNVFKCCESG